MALKLFVFSDGTRLETGDWACIPLRAMLHDSQLYPEPMEFHGFRFAEQERPGGFLFSQPEGSSKLTDVSNKWHVWGTGKMTWYEKSSAPKTLSRLTYAYVKCWKVLCCYRYQTHLGTYFETLRLRLVDENKSRSLTWRTSILPRKETQVSFKARV